MSTAKTADSYKNILQVQRVLYSYALLARIAYIVLFSIAFAEKTKCYDKLMTCGYVILAYCCFEFVIYSLLFFLLIQLYKNATDGNISGIATSAILLLCVACGFMFGALFIFVWWIYTIVRLTNKHDDCKEEFPFFYWLVFTWIIENSFLTLIIQLVDYRKRGLENKLKEQGQGGALLG